MRLSLKKKKWIIRFGLMLTLVVGVSVGATTWLSLSSNVEAASYPTKELCEKYGGTWEEVPRADQGVTYSCKNAASRLVSAYTPEEEIKSFSYFTAMAHCVGGDKMQSVIQTKFSDNKMVPPSEWFTGFSWSNDYYAKAPIYPEGERSCESIVPKAMELWGFGKDYASFLSKLGYKFDPSTLQWKSNGDRLLRVTNLEKALEEQVYNSFDGYPALSGAASYLEKLYFFTSPDGCSAKDLGVYPSLGGVAAYKPLVDQGIEVKNEGEHAIANIASDITLKYTKLHIISEDRMRIEHGFVYSSSLHGNPIRFHAFEVAVSAGGFDRYADRSIACDEIAKNLSSLSADYFAWLAKHPEADVTGLTDFNCERDCTEEGTTSCAIEGIGWMICPVFNFLGGVADGTYGIIAGLLQTDIKVLDTDSGTYQAWEIMRNISNVGLAIAMLIIIFSQLTSLGISNYGVKKMLPRLIIVAIAINLSFIIAQLAVDISNILGVSLKQFLEGVKVFDGALSDDGIATGSLFSDITGQVLTGTAVVATGAVAVASVAFAGPGLLLPVLAAGVLAVILTLFVLIARQAMIILLVVVAPLALLALLFPNTENLFKQWRKMFIAMLILFPAISLLFGGARIASGVLMQTLSDNVLGTIAALAVMVLPLFAVPMLIKASLNAIPFLGGLANAAMSKSGGLLKRTGGNAARNSWGGKYLDYRRKEAERKRALTISGSGTGLRSRLNKRFNNSKYSGQFGDRLITQGIKTADTIQDEHIADRALRMQGDYDPGELVAGASRELSEAIRQGDIIRARAAQHILGTQTGARGLDELHSVYSRDMNKEEVVKSDVGTSLRRGLGAIPGLKGRDAVLDAFKHHDIAKNGFVTVKEITKDPRTYAGLNPEELAAQSVTQLKEGQATITREMAQAVLTTEEAKKYLSDEKRRLFESKV